MTADPLIGTEVAGYRIDEVLGRGGMGIVYKAHDPRVDRHVALKVIAPELSGDTMARDRFIAEARAAARIEHRHILPVYEVEEHQGRLVIVTRLVENSTDLSQLIRYGEPFDPRRAIGITKQVADALAAAHSKGVIHRDVKPANIVVAPPDVSGGPEHCYLTDFGIAQHADDEVSTVTGQVLGTPHYMAPERIDVGEVDERADIYSLGCVLYECLTGSKPFPREDERAVMYAHVHEPPPLATAIRPELPPVVDDVIAMAMAKAPEERFASAAEMRDALRETEQALEETVPMGAPDGTATEQLVQGGTGTRSLVARILQRHPPSPRENRAAAPAGVARPQRRTLPWEEAPDEAMPSPAEPAPRPRVPSPTAQESDAWGGPGMHPYSYARRAAAYVGGMLLAWALVKGTIGSGELSDLDVLVLWGAAAITLIGYATCLIPPSVIQAMGSTLDDVQSDRLNKAATTAAVFALIFTIYEERIRGLLILLVLIMVIFVVRRLSFRTSLGVSVGLLLASGVMIGSIGGDRDEAGSRQPTRSSGGSQQGQSQTGTGPRKNRARENGR